MPYNVALVEGFHGCGLSGKRALNYQDLIVERARTS